MLWLAVMFFLVLRLLGYRFKVGGNAIHLLLAAVAVLFVITLLTSNASRFRRQKPSGEHMQGRIKWVNPEKEWGFIECEGGLNVFFHGSSFDFCERQALHEGDKVEFTLEEPGASVAKRVVGIKVLRHWSMARRSGSRL